MNRITNLVDECICGKGISRQDALLLVSEETNIYELIHAANSIRQNFFGNKIAFCSIINAKSGLCPNNCAFCAQSAFHHTGVKATAIISPKTALDAAESAFRNHSINFGLVTSGVKLDDDNLNAILDAIRKIKNSGSIGVCASLGELDKNRACLLYEAGIRTYHHNLETSPRFYPQICSTYDYKHKIRTIEAAKKAGMKICCGGIFGLGETWEDRIDMAMEIRCMDASSIPLNFLNPIKGTPLESQHLLPPLEALRIIAIYRFIFPDKTIKICGGRETVLGDMQSWMFYAGANGTMVGDYLTTKGRSPEADLRMLKDLGLEPANIENSAIC